MNTSPAVEVHDLVKRYGRITAVDGLSLSAERGAVTAVLGPNGAGKTSTVEICEGYRRPDAGTVSVLGLDPVSDARRLQPAGFRPAREPVEVGHVGAPRRLRRARGGEIAIEHGQRFAPGSAQRGFWRGFCHA